MAKRRVYPEHLTRQHGHTHEICPACGAELCAGLILEKGREYQPADPQGYARAYGWPERRCFGATIGIEVRGIYDGISYWAYPCCGLVVDRFTREEALPDLRDSFWDSIDAIEESGRRVSPPPSAPEQPEPCARGNTQRSRKGRRNET